MCASDPGISSMNRNKVGGRGSQVIAVPLNRLPTVEVAQQGLEQGIKAVEVVGRVSLAKYKPV
jgi:hypothetical protein